MIVRLNEWHFVLSISFDPRDFWIGLYVPESSGFMQFFVCIVPMFPIYVAWYKESQ